MCNRPLCDLRSKDFARAHKTVFLFVRPHKTVFLSLDTATTRTLFVFIFVCFANECQKVSETHEKVHSLRLKIFHARLYLKGQKASEMHEKGHSDTHTILTVCGMKSR
jgi:hypothetical protein